MEMVHDPSFRVSIRVLATDFVDEGKVKEIIDRHRSEITNEIEAISQN
jgi:hypothetical protein